MMASTSIGLVRHGGEIRRAGTHPALRHPSHPCNTLPPAQNSDRAAAENARADRGVGPNPHNYSSKNKPIIVNLPALQGPPRQRRRAAGEGDRVGGPAAPPQV